MKRLLLGSIFVFSVLSVAGQVRVDLEKEKAELLRIHRSDREAHFKTNPELLLQRSPDEMISVNQGKIERAKKEDRQKIFAEYFKGAKYLEWDDLEEPIIRISNDGSMAWMITRLKVRRTQADSNGKEQETKFVYAGIMTYERRSGEWIKVANVSTFEPSN